MFGCRDPTIMRVIDQMPCVRGLELETRLRLDDHDPAARLPPRW